MIENALLSVGLLIVVAKLLEGVLRRFRLNAIVAYTATGILLGPVAGVIEPTAEMQILLGIGIFLLFFLIGLDELDISGFMAAVRGRYFVAATLSVLVPLLAAMAVTSDILHDFGLGLDYTEAIALAGILSLTSLGVAAKVLVDEGHLREPIGIRIFTTALIAELIALLVVGFTIGEHTQEMSWSGVLVLLAQIAGFTVVTWILASRVIPPLIVLLQRFLYRNARALVPPWCLARSFAPSPTQRRWGCTARSVTSAVRGRTVGDAFPGPAGDRSRHAEPSPIGWIAPLFFAAAGLHVSLSWTELPIETIVTLVIVSPARKVRWSAHRRPRRRGWTRTFALATDLMAKGVAEVALPLVLLETDESSVRGRVLPARAHDVRLAILLTPPAINVGDGTPDPVTGTDTDRPSRCRHQSGTLRPGPHHRRRHARPQEHISGPDASRCAQLPIGG